jgi:menaquinol-cytochrome c reductase iron-sulfur subunit
MTDQGDTNRDDQMDVRDESRRRFLSVAAGAISTAVAALIGIPLVGMFFGPLFARRKELWLDIGAVADVKPNRPTKFTYSYVKIDGWFEKTVYGTAYVEADRAGIFALSNICTHLGCGVRWDTDRNAFTCPCHNGVFDRMGNVVSGPPPRSLNRLKTKIAAGRIHILIPEV